MIEYGCIVADPPWAEHGGGNRGAQNHYPLLKTPRIVDVMLGSPAFHYHRDRGRPQHLWLWVTNNYLRDGIYVMEALGFRYITNMAWVKTRPGRPNEFELRDLNRLQIGLGFYLRGSHELCLLGVRGATAMPERGMAPPSVLFAPRREHSQKPDEAIEIFERVSMGPYIELFARQQRKGWESWGNEVSDE